MTAPSGNLLGRVADRVNWRTISGPLFRKYVALFVAVVCVALLSNGLFEIWFRLPGEQAALTRIQREQARRPPPRNRPVHQGHRRPDRLDHAAAVDGERDRQRRFDALRLLRQVPAITELVATRFRGQGAAPGLAARPWTNGRGRTDISKDPKFTEAVAKKVYYGPVYFRRESEPYMTLSLAGARRDAGVSVAEVNLKFIWDVVSQIKVGKHGQAFVIDAQGRLIAHPDISLVLRNTDMSGSTTGAGRARGRVRRRAGGRRERQGRAGPQGADRARADRGRCGWLMFVELPIDEAYAPLYESIRRSAASAAGRAHAGVRLPACSWRAR